MKTGNANTFSGQEKNISGIFKKVSCYNSEGRININAVGTTATDFVYTLPNGAFEKIHHLSAEYLVLFFYKPGCHFSKEMEIAIENSIILSLLQKENKLKVLAMYTGTDMFSWWTYSKSVLKTWLNGYNSLLCQDHDYYLPVLPTLYLLDKDKKILLKDVSVSGLENHFSAHHFGDSVFSSVTSGTR